MRLLSSVIALSTLLFTTACNRDVAPSEVNWNNAYLVQPVGTAPAVMYLVINNTTDEPDTLLEVSSPLSREIEIHEEISHDSVHEGMPVNMVHMNHIEFLPIPAGSSVHLEPGATHLMIHNPEIPFEPGDSITFSLTFARAGVIEGKVAVITYADVDTAVIRSK